MFVRMRLNRHKVMGPKYVCCPHNTNFMGAIAPIAPMVSTPNMLIDKLFP